MRIQRIFIVLAWGMGITANLVFGQSLEDNLSRNTFYVELAGASLYPSLNYERSFPVGENTFIGARVGFARKLQLLPYGPAIASNVLLPMQLLVRHGRGPHFGELGAGLTALMTESLRQSNNIIRPNFSVSEDPVTALQLGYRYHPRKGGLLLRVNYSLLYANDRETLTQPDNWRWVHYFGLGIGWALRPPGFRD